MALGAALGAYGTPVDVAAAGLLSKASLHKLSQRRAPEAVAGPKKQQPRGDARSGAAPRNVPRNGTAPALRGVDPEQLQLVTRVKQAQKSHESVRTKWRDYCDEMGNGTRDPTLHTAIFLRKFFDLLAAGSIPVCPDPLHKWPIPGLEMNEDEAHRVLVAKVKHGQQSTDFKECWWKFCDGSPSGMRDPLRYDNTSLRHFLLHIAPDGGSMPDKNPYAAPPQHVSDLSDCVRRLQSSKLVWKHQWDHYSDTFGNGVRDPARHPASFLEAFILQAMPPCPAKLMPVQLCASQGIATGLAYPPGLEGFAAAADDVDGSDSHGTEEETSQDSGSTALGHPWPYEQQAVFPWKYEQQAHDYSFFSMDVMSFTGAL